MHHLRNRVHYIGNLDFRQFSDFNDGVSSQDLTPHTPMKHSHSPRGGRLMIGMLACLCTINTTFAASAIPTGSLTVDRTLVRVGTRSQLGWQIAYPNKEPRLDPTYKCKMRVRNLGVAFQSGSTLLPCEASWSKNGSAYTRFFYGTGPSVIPTNVLIDTTLNIGDKVTFSGRGWSGSAWFPSHATNTGDQYAVVLKNGDSAPSYAPAYNQASAKSFLAPYIDGSGKIKIGPNDLIVLWECSTAAPGTTYFDMQDIVLLVTFEEITTP